MLFSSDETLWPPAYLPTHSSIRDDVIAGVPWKNHTHCQISFIAVCMRQSFLRRTLTLYQTNTHAVQKPLDYPKNGYKKFIYSFHNSEIFERTSSIELFNFNPNKATNISFRIYRLSSETWLNFTSTNQAMLHTWTIISKVDDLLLALIVRMRENGIDPFDDITAETNKGFDY